MVYQNRTVFKTIVMIIGKV